MTETRPKTRHAQSGFVLAELQSTGNGDRPNAHAVTARAGTPSPEHSGMGDLGSVGLSGGRNSAQIIVFGAKALYRVTEAMAVLSMSRTVIYEQMRAGRLRFVLQGTVRRITAEAIAEYVALLERERNGGAR